MANITQYYCRRCRSWKSAATCRLCGSKTVPFEEKKREELPATMAAVWDPVSGEFVFINWDDIRHIIDTVDEVKAEIAEIKEILNKCKSGIDDIMQMLKS